MYLNKSHGPEDVEPSGKGKGAQEGGEQDGVGGEGAVVALASGHNVGTGGGGGGQHDEDGDQLVGAVAQPYRQGQEYGGKEKELAEDGQEGGLEFGQCNSCFGRRLGTIARFSFAR